MKSSLGFHLVLLAFLSVTGLAIAAGKARDAAKYAPIPAAEAVSTHGPFEAGDCAVCHKDRKGGDMNRPGEILKAPDELCFDCHDEFKGSAAKKLKHPRSQTDCISCHNPHNARFKSLRYGP